MSLRIILKAIRIHQWAKNSLIFVPLLAAHKVLETDLLIAGLLAFISFSLLSSCVYLINDILDIKYDQQHPEKCLRPIACGDMTIQSGIILATILFLLSLALSVALLPINFLIVLTLYLIMSLAYSLWIKRVVMLDVVVLALLYTSRVIAGGMAMSLAITFWIVAFCIFIFLSLAFVKRYAELYNSRSGNASDSSGRGYRDEDFEILASLGGASGFLSVLVLALYINDASSGHLYPSHEIMWLSCPLLIYWISRIWLLAHRGEMSHDPVIFALSDRASLLTGILFVSVFLGAAF